MIIFTHIAKTAGTSFAASIRDCYSNRFEFEEMETYSRNNKLITECFENKEKIDVESDFVHSHIPYGFHSIFNTEDYKYITILRDPIKRCVSSIRHSAKIRNTKGLVGDDVFANLFRHQNSDTDFINSLRENEINCNIMTKQLSGMNYKDVITDPNMKLQAQYYMPYSHCCRSYTDDEMKEMLGAAKRNLDTYAFIGLQDRFEESLRKYEDVFSCKTKKVSKKLKSTRGTMDLSSIDKDSIDCLNDMNKYDIELYDYVLERLIDL